jgi:hypothetical protein
MNQAMSRFALGILMAIALAYIGLCALMFFQQRSLMYFPVPEAPLPAGATAIMLPVDGARIAVTAVHPDRPQALIYFGGNAESVNGSLSDLIAAFPNHAIYLMHYRGYGPSTGEPSERVLVSDAIALYDRLRAQHAQIEVAGRSLGSGIAVQLAGARPVQRLVLITPFDSMRNVAAAHYGYLPVRWLMRDTYESVTYAARVAAPTTIIAAEHDRIVPPSHAKALFDSFPRGVATMTVIEGVGHNDISLSPRYIPALRGTTVTLAERSNP